MSAPIPFAGVANDQDADSDSERLGAPLVHSTSPPCIPCLPPSPGSAPPPSASILRNPLPLGQSPPRAGPSLQLSNPFRRGSGDPQARRRAPSFTVEVYQPPPPAHFFTAAAGDTSDGSAPSAPGSTFGTSPPRAQMPPHGLRSRSVSPAASPILRSPAPTIAHLPLPGTSPGDGGGGGESSTNGALLQSPGAESVLTLASSGSGSSLGTASGQSVKFAPLPPGRRAHRSNSLSIGVASRAKMIQRQGGAPNVRSARYAGPLQWYEGGPMPEDVYTWKDVQRGVTKLFKRVKGSSASSATSEGGDPVRGRSASVSSATSSSSSVDEARRMEREAKGKSREIEHIEEAEEDDVEAAKPVLDERDEISATVSDEEGDEADAEGEGGPTFDDEDDDGTSASENTAPRTPPEGDLRDGDLEIERRRVRKGKGVDDAEHRGVQVASS